MHHRAADGEQHPAMQGLQRVGLNYVGKSKYLNVGINVQ